MGMDTPNDPAIQPGEERADIERHEIVCPRIDVFYTEHLYCGEDDLFGSGHPPDTVVAMALAYHAFKTGRQPGDYGFTI